MKIEKEKSQWFNYKFCYDFTLQELEFCRQLKTKLGYQEFGYSDDAWRFNDLAIVEFIKKRYPDIEVTEEVEKYLIEWCIDNLKSGRSNDIVEQKDPKSVFKSSDLYVSPEEYKSLIPSEVEVGLRDYQIESINAVLWALKKNINGNYLLSLPTGSGKSFLISSLVRILGVQILILQPSREILVQNYGKLSKHVDGWDMGVYSASMNEKVVRTFTFATIGSIYKIPQKFVDFDYVLLDECHLLEPRSLDGMYSSFFNKVNGLRSKTGKPPIKVIGLSATPYRMAINYMRSQNGDLYAFTTTKLINRMKNFFWKRLLYNINVQELIDKGYLCPLEYIDKTIVEHEDIPLNKSKSEFDLDKYEDLLTDKQLKILQTIKYAESISKSVLVFCPSVKQAKVLSGAVDGSAVVTAKTSKEERDRVTRRFKEGKIKTVLNVGVYAIGFDYPGLDCVVLLRPTRSIGLLYQMVGRGLRIAPGKKSCKVIDMTSTIKNLGRIETIRLEKIDGKWELLSEKGSWHNRELFSFKIKKKESTL